MIIVKNCFAILILGIVILIFPKQLTSVFQSRWTVARDALILLATTMAEGM
jgi:hypothetical protein